LKDLIKENKRVITRAIRELDRERTRMEREEKKLIADIKKMANQGQMKAVTIQAKELVRTKNYITKFLQMRAHLNAVLLKIQTVKSHEAVRLLIPFFSFDFI
jgi:charged multivesicular body protein 2A